MLKGFKSKTLLYKLFVSYLLIFVAPLIIMTGILYKTSVVDLEREIENSNLHKLKQMEENVNLRMKELQYIAIKIGLDQRLTPSAMNSVESKRIEGINQLSMYKINNAFIDELFIYYKGIDRVFATSGHYSLSTLTKYIYVMDEASQKSFIEDMNTLEAPKLRPAENASLYQSEPSPMLTYLYPVYYQSDGPGAVVMFMISKSSFDKMSEDLLGDMPGDVFMCSSTGDVLLSTVAGPSKYTGSEMKQLSGFRDDGIHYMDIGGARHSVISVTSEVTGWKFIAAIQTSQLFKKVIYMRTVILQIVLSLLTFGIFVIIIIASKNYKPIKNIMGLINMQWASDDGEEESDSDELSELDQISRAVEKAISQNRDLKAQIDLQRPFVAEQLLTNLLNGGIRDEKMITNLLKLSKLVLSGPYYTVLVLAKRVDSENRTSYVYKDNVMLALRKHFSESGKAYPIELIHNNAIAFIANLKEEEMEKECQKKLADEIQCVVEEQISEETIIGIGKMSDSLTQINRSYIEAMAVLENSARSEAKVVFFDEVMKEQKQIYWYPAEDQLRFIESLKQGDKAVALSTIDSMIGNIAEKGASTLMVKYVCFDIVNMIIKTVNEMNMNEFNDDIAKLMEFAALSDLEENLRMLTIKFCEFIQQKRTNKDVELYTQILHYVNSNFDDVNLSLDNISLKFRLPIYYLSRFFKEQTGSTFTEHITKLRMEKAKDLLVNTKKPLKEIMVSIGYTDLPSFIRRFKKIHSITPGQYREMNSKM